jgi:hypothetical protein
MFPTAVKRLTRNEEAAGTAELTEAVCLFGSTQQSLFFH